MGHRFTQIFIRTIANSRRARRGERVGGWMSGTSAGSGLEVGGNRQMTEGGHQKSEVGGQRTDYRGQLAEIVFQRNS
jgi:hypothetical protein